MILHKPPTSERNYFGPRADRLSIAYAVDGGVGHSDLPNLGLGYPTAVPATGVSLYNGVILNSSSVPIGSTWSSNSDDGPFIYLSSALNHNVRVRLNSTGSTIAFTRGTMMLRFSMASLPGETQTIFNGGGNANASHRIAALCSASNILGVNFSDSNSTSASDHYKMTWADNVVETNKIYTMIITWGEKGLNAWLDGVEGNLTQIPGPILPGEPGFIDARTTGQPITTDYWQVVDGDEIRIGRNSADAYADMNLFAFCLWDVQLDAVEIEELFCDSYLPFRPRAKDYSGSNETEIFRTDVNPIPVRPRLDLTNIEEANKDEITFSVVTDEDLPDGYTVYMRVHYDTDPYMQNPVLSQTSSDDLPDHQFNLILGGLQHASTYYYIAQYSVDNEEWHTFPGGKGKFKTQKRGQYDFNFAFLTDDHICNHAGGGPPLDSGGSYTGYIGYGGDTLRWIVSNFPSSNGSEEGYKCWDAWHAIYDIYCKQDVDFIVIGGDYYYGDNPNIYSPDTSAPQTTPRLAQSWRNWFNLLYKCGVVFYVQGNHENEAGYLQREDEQNNPSYTTQMRTTIVRKKFFPNPTNATYLQGGEYETPHNGEVNWIPDAGNDWIPTINTQSSTEGNNLTPGQRQVTYNQDYRNQYILGIDESEPSASSIDPYAMNRSPLENYFAWTWGDVLFSVIDVYRYTEVGDPKNTGGNHFRYGPTWVLGPTQKAWLRSVLSRSNEESKFIFAHNLLGGEAIAASGVRLSDTIGWYGRASGALINETIGVDGLNAYYDGTQQTESPEEIEIHELMQQYGVTAYVKGHDHKFSHVIKDGIHYITGSTPSAPSIWEGPAMRNSYGYTESQNDQNTQAEALGIQSTTNTRGYCLFSLQNGDWTCINRCTSLSPQAGSTLSAKNYTNVRLGGISEQKCGPGWAGPQYSPNQSNQITLSEIPRDIYCICTVANAQFSGVENESGIWTAGSGVVALANLHTGIGDDWDEFYGNSTITLLSAPGSDVNVMHVPVATYSGQIQNTSDSNILSALTNIRVSDASIISSASTVYKTGTVNAQVINFSGQQTIYKINVDAVINNEQGTNVIEGQNGVVSFQAANFQNSRNSYAFQPVVHWLMDYNWQTSGTSIANTFQTSSYLSDITKSPYLSYTLYFDEEGVYDLWGYGYSSVGLYWSIDDDTSNLREVQLNTAGWPGSPLWTKFGSIYVAGNVVKTFKVYSGSSSFIMLDQWYFTKQSDLEDELHSNTTFETPRALSKCPFNTAIRLRSLLNGDFVPLDETSVGMTSVSAWCNSQNKVSSDRLSYWIANSETDNGVVFTDGVSIEFWQIGGSNKHFAAWKYNIK